jgi:hypothetical protein
MCASQYERLCLGTWVEETMRLQVTNEDKITDCKLADEAVTRGRNSEIAQHVDQGNLSDVLSYDKSICKVEF